MDKKMKDHLEYQVLIFAPDGRFSQEPIEGGIDRKTAIHIAKEKKEMGLIVKIFDKKNKQFVNY